MYDDNLGTHLVATLSGKPSRADIDRQLLELSTELRFDQEPRDILIDATGLLELDTSLDLEILSWIALHYELVRRVAIATPQPSCGPWIAQLALRSRKPIRVFDSRWQALKWLVDYG